MRFVKLFEKLSPTFCCPAKLLVGLSGEEKADELADTFPLSGWCKFVWMELNAEGNARSRRSESEAFGDDPIDIKCCGTSIACG